MEKDVEELRASLESGNEYSSWVGMTPSSHKGKIALFLCSVLIEMENVTGVKLSARYNENDVKKVHAYRWGLLTVDTLIRMLDNYTKKPFKTLRQFLLSEASKQEDRAHAHSYDDLISIIGSKKDISTMFAENVRKILKQKSVG